MDLHLRNLVRQYSASPTDELARALAAMVVRSSGASAGPGIMEQFYDAYWWLQQHPLFLYAGTLSQRISHSSFPQNLSIYTTKVDPVTRTVEDDRERNTFIEVWLEVTVYEPLGDSEDLSGWDERTGIPTHFWQLDCGGDTFEEAIIKLAQNVWARRGYIRTHTPLPATIPQPPELTSEEHEAMQL